MQKEVKKSWALFIGIGVMMIAHGLQMQIMGIRSVLEGTTQNLLGQRQDLSFREVVDGEDSGVYTTREISTNALDIIQSHAEKLSEMEDLALSIFDNIIDYENNALL